MDYDYLLFLETFGVHLLVVLTVVPVVLLRRKAPQATVAWLLALAVVPLFGAILFLVFGNTRIQRRANRHKAKRKHTRSRLPERIFNMNSPIDIRGQLQLYKLLEKIGPFQPLPGNDLEVYFDIEENYAAQIEAIDNAKFHVHFMYYIVECDESGRRFQDALIRAASRGVTVRVLVDAVGCYVLPGAYLEKLRDAGVQVSTFMPFQFATRFSINFRNHRKILVVDGTVGFVGGANIGDEYISKSRFGRWIDLHSQVHGPLVRQLQAVFLEDWEFATDQEVGDHGQLFPELEPAGDLTAEVVPGGPDLPNPVYHELYFCAVANAVSQVRILTPFFVPSESVLTAMVTAAHRGVKVELVVPRHSTKQIVYWASRSYYDELLEAGVNIYEVTEGFLHAKLVTVDGRWSCMGTANFDNRSMRLNFELGVVCYDADMTAKYNEIFDKVLKETGQVDYDHWSERGWPARMVENTARLFAPVL